MKIRPSLSGVTPLMCVYALCFLLAGSPVHAGPGGIIVAVEKTWLGRVVTIILIIVLSPIIILDAIQRRRAIKRTMSALNTLSQCLPQYRWLDFTDQVTNAFSWVWSAWSHQKMEEVSAFTTDWYWQNQQLLLDDWKARGVTNICSLNKIGQIKPLLVQHNPQNQGDGSRIVVQIDATVVDYLVDESGKLMKGSKTPSELRTVWTFLYQGDAWKLNRIDESATVWDYLKLQNETTLTASSQQSSI